MSNIISPVFRSELTEGNFKVIYQSESKGIFILYHKDDDLAIAEIRSRLSAKLFSVLTSCGIKNHFLCSNGIFEHKVLALDVLPFKFVVYSVVNEDLSKKIFLKPGLKLDNYLVEVYFKTGNKSNDSVLLSKEHLVSLDSFTSDLADHLFCQSRRIMDIVYSFFQALGINVFSLSLSFGKQYKNDGQNFEIVLADEMSLKNINLSLSLNGSSNSKDSYLKISDKLNFNISI